MRKTLLCTLPDTGGPVDWWRAITPFLDLDQRIPDYKTDFFEFGFGTMCSWIRAQQAMAMFIMYPYKAELHQMYMLTEMTNKPNWIDLDDNYWNIPESNFAKFYFTPQALNLLERGIAQSSIVTVSTLELKEQVERIRPKCNPQVIPNAIPDSYEWPTSRRQKTVIYRGSHKTHAADLYSVSDDLRAVVRENQDWTFVFFGGHPIYVNEPNVKFLDAAAIPMFHRLLNGSQASIFINPLEFSYFNECKSNIAWIEASLAGAAFLGPDLPPYREPGATVYKPGKFGERLREMIAMSEFDRNQLVARSQKTIDSKYRLSVVNPLRAKIIESLM